MASGADPNPLENDTTAVICPAQGEERWWVFLVTSSLIYIISLSLCSITYCLYWVIINKYKLISSEEMGTSDNLNTRNRSCFIFFRKFTRQLISGHTIPGKLLITITLICNVIYILLSIFRTYSPSSAEECFSLFNEPAKIAELVVVIELILYAIVRFLAADNIVSYWLNVYTIVDVFTLPHIFVSIALGVDWIGLRSLRFICMTQMTTVLSFTPFLYSQDALDVITLLIYFLILWLTSSGIIHLVETQGDPWRKFENSNDSPILVYVYYIMVTMSTVGYGDILPLTDLGRTFMTFFIVAGLAFFAAILPKLVDVTSHFYSKNQYAKFDTTRVLRHVIVCGHITATTAEDFLDDFLHPDRGDSLTHVLFVSPERPDSDLKTVLRSRFSRVQFLLGTVLNGECLINSKIHLAAAVFILANKYTDNPLEEDNASLLRVVSIKNVTSKIPIIIQVLHSFSKKQVFNIGGWKVGQDVALCLNELKLGLLAQSCLLPGFSTLIGNLFYTSTFHESTKYSPNESWKRGYIKGVSNEIYSSVFSQGFDGKTFHEAAWICYNKLNLTLFALEHIEEENGCYHYYVNPSPLTRPDIQIKSNVMLGYFIAPDQTAVSVVSTYCECCPGHKHIAPKENNQDRRMNIRQLRRTVSPDQFLELGPVGDNLMPTSATKKRASYMVSRSCSDDNTTLKQSTVGEITPRDDPARVGQEEEDPVRSNKKTELLSDDEGDDKEEEEEEEEEVVVEEGDIMESNFQHRVHVNRLEESFLNPSKISIQDRILELNSDISNHIVLCIFANRKSPILGLHTFLKPLRSTLLPPDSIKPVVIISDRAFIEKIWPLIQNIPKVYLVIGSPLRSWNLKIANVTKCSVCVILSVLPSLFSHDQAVDDKEAILCTLSIKKKLKKKKKHIHIITDLKHDSNVRFLDLDDEEEPDGKIYKAQPFACGEAFSVSVFDSVTSSLFHGPGSLFLVEDLIHASWIKSPRQVIVVPVPDAYHGMTFRAFYNSQLERYNICLGLTRKLPMNHSRSYVITCPDPSTVLKEGDIAFVLSE